MKQVEFFLKATLQTLLISTLVFPLSLTAAVGKPSPSHSGLKTMPRVEIYEQGKDIFLNEIESYEGTEADFEQMKKNLRDRCEKPDQDVVESKLKLSPKEYLKAKENCLKLVESITPQNMNKVKEQVEEAIQKLKNNHELQAAVPVIAILLILSALGLIGCGGSDDDDSYDPLMTRFIYKGKLVSDDPTADLKAEYSPIRFCAYFEMYQVPYYYYYQDCFVRTLNSNNEFQAEVTYYNFNPGQVSRLNEYDLYFYYYNGMFYSIFDGFEVQDFSKSVSGHDIVINMNLLATKPYPDSSTATGMQSVSFATIQRYMYYYVPNFYETDYDHTAAPLLQSAESVPLEGLIPSVY